MVTGKNKEQFEKWLHDNYDSIEVVEEINTIEYFICNNLTAYDIFYNLPFEMQIGVYLAYYDSKGIYVDIVSYDNQYYWMPIVEYILESEHETRKEAYKEAFKQADKLMNNE